LKGLKTYFFIFCLIFSIYSFSQEIKPGKPNELDNIYSPDKTASKPIVNAQSTVDAFKSNFIKFNFGLLARSTFALHYERKFNDIISIVGGLGYNYNKDKIQLASAEGDLFIVDNSKSSVNLSQIIINGTYDSGPNLFASAAVKFSYDGLFSSWNYDEERRNFIQLEWRNSSFNMDLNDLKLDNEQVSNGNDLTIKNTCYLLNWGFQFTTGKNIITSHEFSVGCGIRKITYNVFTSTVTYDPFGQSYTLHQKTSGTETATSPMVTIAYVLGFGF